MPKMITKNVSGVVMYGQLVGVGYIPAEEKSDSGEKYYIQVTAPALTSHKPRMTDEAYRQFELAGGENIPMGAPIMMDVSHSLFNGNIYWRAESFAVRSDAGPPFAGASALSFGAAPRAGATGSTSAPRAGAGAAASSASSPSSASDAAKKP